MQLLGASMQCFHFRDHCIKGNSSCLYLALVSMSIFGLSLPLPPAPVIWTIYMWRDLLACPLLCVCGEMEFCMTVINHIRQADTAPIIDLPV